MQHYCTYFDRNFLVRGVTLYRSLIKHAGAFSLWVLCLDDVSFDSLKKLNAPGLYPIRLAELEAEFPELQAAKANRSRIEYFFTCSPALPRFVLNRDPSIDVITYLDADLYFFADPAPILDEMRNKSILIIEHKFPAALQHLEKYGRFNVGFLSFRNDTAGRDCLDLWRRKCVEWCYDRVEDGKFADQKYLDEWPSRFPETAIVRHLGANVAPWNVGMYDVQHTKDGVTVNGVELIFYHFHRLRILNSWLCDPGLLHFQNSRVPRELRKWVYKPYLHALAESWKWVQGLSEGLHPGFVQVQTGRYTYANMLRDAARSFLHGQLLVSVRGFR